MKATSAQKDRIENARAYLATNDAAKPRLLQQILGESRESAHESLRINTCHDFAWSRKLWADAARQTAYIAIAATFVYLGLGFYLLAYSDGLRGVDCWYFLATTLTTVGLGDIYPEKESTRLTAIVMLPFGLIVVGFGISYLEAMALAKSDELSAKADYKLGHGQNNVRWKTFSRQYQVFCDWRTGTLAGKFFTLLLKFMCVVLVGTLFFVAYDDEWKKQSDVSKMYDDPSGAFTFVDAMFFSVVVSTTVGYGHRISPITDGAKIFMIIYMFVATTIVGQILNELAEIYLHDVAEESITEALIDSTIWVHKSDVNKNGLVDEAEYCLFKLQQMQALDVDTLERLQRRFTSLDSGEQGLLELGTEVPNAEQVKRLQEIQKEPSSAHRSLPELWAQHRSVLSREHRRNSSAKKLSSAVSKVSALQMFTSSQENPGDEEKHPEISTEDWLVSECDLEVTIARAFAPRLQNLGFHYKSDFFYYDFRENSKEAIMEEVELNIEDFEKFHSTVLQLKKSVHQNQCTVDPETGAEVKPIKISKCHDFAWSRELWAEQSQRLGYMVLLCTIAYLLVGYFVLAHLDGKKGLTGWYFLSATLSTVGYGDFAPIHQITRLVAVFLIPFGLVNIGFALSWSRAHAKAQPPKVSLESKMEVLDEVEGDGDGILGTDEVLMSLRRSSLIPHISDGDEDENRIDIYDVLATTICFKVFLLLLKMAAILSVGAIFFKMQRTEKNRLELSWIEAYYFAVVTATSIGYGDITPSSNAGKLFLVFYMLLSTIVVAEILGNAIDIYVNDYVGEAIVRKIIDSTTWVHKSDIHGKGSVSEAEYILFKLQQLQKVDRELLDRLINRFNEIDVGKQRFLVVGEEIPSAEQVKAMQEKREFTNGSRTLMQLWNEHLEKKQGVSTNAAKNSDEEVNAMGGSKSSETYIKQNELSNAAVKGHLELDEAQGDIAESGEFKAPMREERGLLEQSQGSGDGLANENLLNTAQAATESAAEGVRAAALLARQSSEMMINLTPSFDVTGVASLWSSSAVPSNDSDSSRIRHSPGMGTSL